MKTISIIALIISLIGILMCCFIFYFDENPYYEGYFYITLFIIILYLSITSLFYDEEY